MHRPFFIFAAGLALAAATLASAAGPPGANTLAEPAPRAPVSFFEAAQVKARFAKGQPILEIENYKIHASRREGQPGQAEVHERDTDIIYVLEGEATFVTGGRASGLVGTASEELRGSAIEGGHARELAPGDLVVVPAGTPHQFTRTTNPFLYYVVKVRAPEGASP